jgi:hypothetical protein
MVCIEYSAKNVFPPKNTILRPVQLGLVYFSKYFAKYFRFSVTSNLAAHVWSIKYR